MTQAKEGIKRLEKAIDADSKCDYVPSGLTWKCKLAGSSTSLGNNMTRPKPVTPASIDDVTKKKWPSQAHHLIPWQQLEKHPVTQWLAESPPKAPKIMKGDNDYSVDHGNNGKWMPYASALKEWKSASTTKKADLSNRVMKAAGIQLHQGPHSYLPYGDTDTGYKTRVEEYLTKIKSHFITHYKTCKTCKPSDKQKKVPPRRNLVKLMDASSRGLDGDIRAGRIFVSERAFLYADAGGAVGG